MMEVDLDQRSVRMRLEAAGDQGAQMLVLADAIDKLMAAMGRSHRYFAEKHEHIAASMASMDALRGQVEKLQQAIDAEGKKAEGSAQAIDAWGERADAFAGASWCWCAHGREWHGPWSWSDRHYDGDRRERGKDEDSAAVDEPSREEVNLKLLGGPLSPGGKEGAVTPRGRWEYPVVDERFAGLLRGAVAVSARPLLFDKVYHGINWGSPDEPTPRRTAWTVAPSCKCSYAFSGDVMHPQPWPHWMEELLAEVMPLCGITTQAEWPNSCFLNLYEDGGGVGWHADDEPLFQGYCRDCAIVSLSLGQGRDFEMYSEAVPPEKAPVRCCLRLENGDLCTMEGLFQKYYWHSAPWEEDAPSPRINLTWRWIVEHRPDCPAGGKTSIGEEGTSNDAG